jgi:hypothetical protein
MAGSIDPPDELKDPQHIIDYENRMNAMWSQQLSAQQSDTHRESRALSPEERSQQNLDSGAITPRIYEKATSDQVIKKAMSQLRSLLVTSLHYVGSIPPTPFAPEEYYSSESIPPTADYTNTHAFVYFIREDNEGFKLHYNLNKPQQLKTTDGSQFLDYINSNRDEFRSEYGINQFVKIDEITPQISLPQQSLNDKEKFFDESVASKNFCEERKESKSPEIDDKTKSTSPKSPDNDKSFSSSNTNTPFVSSELSSSTTQIRTEDRPSLPLTLSSAQTNEPKPATSPAQPVSKQGGLLEFWWGGLGARK